MKKLFVSMGLAAASVASVQLAQADGGVDSKVWTASASLRGFYDDNYNTSTSSAKKGSYGLEFSPSVSASVPLRQTDIGIRYTYGLYYYEERDHLGQNAIDQSHSLDLWVDHAFSETWHGKAEDTFAVGQEPELLNKAGGSVSTQQRVKGDNIANTGTLDLKTDWSREFSTDLGYQNHFFDYQQSGWQSAGPLAPSLAGLLNRDENDANIDLDYNYSAHTVFFVGYQIGVVNYIGDETIGVQPGTGKDISSDTRNTISNYGYVGVGIDLLANLRFQGKAGIQYVDYNKQVGSSSTEVSPYADLSLTYTYLPGSYVQLGFNQTRSAVDQATFDSQGRITQDQESSALYASINHEITSKLIGSVIGQYQYSTFRQGSFDGDADKFYTLGVNLTYNFTEHFGAEVGYNYDNLDSSVPGRGYSRNRVYIGVSASY
jgi:hypothetical protein